MARQTDVKVVEARLGFTDYLYRTPIKFGGKACDRATVMDVAVRVRDGSGREAEGFGSMTMGTTWSFPTSNLDYDGTLAAMKDLAARVGKRLSNACSESAHPLDHGQIIEDLGLAEAKAVGADSELTVPVPKLFALVTISPYDAAVHDAYGKLLGCSAYECYGSDYVNHDLAHYLDDQFSGETLDQYVTARPKPRLPLYHLVGALDPLVDADVKEAVGDGMPETLGDWIRYDGLTHLKIKLNGDDVGWDVQRVLAVDRVAEETAADRDWKFSLDFNERCENVDYLLAFLKRIEESTPRALARVQYIEQPTARDLSAHPENKMHAAAKIRPVVIDESLVDYETLMLAEEMGYSGVALKACKGQSQALLMTAAAAKREMFICVQDLTCPGASFLHSAGLAAHVASVPAIEGNARQYMPVANEGWRDSFPTVFKLENGTIETGAINGPGLGVVPPDHDTSNLELVSSG